MLQRYYRDVKSPFARKAARNGYEWNGGKLDDITVVVAQIKAI